MYNRNLELLLALRNTVCSGFNTGCRARQVKKVLLYHSYRILVIEHLIICIYTIAYRCDRIHAWIGGAVELTGVRGGREGDFYRASVRTWLGLIR